MRKGLLCSPFFFAACSALAGPLDAGTKNVRLHARDGTSVDIGQVTFTAHRDDIPAAARWYGRLTID